MRLFIEPTEPLLFRTGRPFDAGENNFAETLFPPTPETIQGAVRAAIATHWKPGTSLVEAFNDSELTNLIGIYNEYGRFWLTGFSLGRRVKENDPDQNKEDISGQKVERLFPAPAHILQEEEGEKRQTRLIPRGIEEDIRTNLPEGVQLLYPDKILENLQGKLEPMKGWLTERGLYKALWTKGDIAKDDIVKESDIYVREPRLGIGMNNKTKTTTEGLLYQVQLVRMNHKLDHPYVYGFVVDIHLAPTNDAKNTPPSDFIFGEEAQKMLHLPDRGWITFGGERRAAYFEVIKPSATEWSDKIGLKKEGDLLYLATPTALDSGWQPGQWKTVSNPIAAAIPRYQSIGGWLLKPGSSGGENKSMRRCVPAGSVYFFEQPVKIDQTLTDHGWQIGYGITYTGDWKR